MYSTSTNFDAKYITWECTTECNYSCSYCWPGCHDGKYRWPDSDKTDKLISYLEDFADGKTVILDIMGGEPTLWPDLERFCHAVGKHSLITFSSNGSRTARWWRNFSAPINHLLFSFHPEFADEEQFAEMLAVVDKRYKTTVMILYHPTLKEKCLAAWDRFTQGDLEIACKMKRIISPVFEDQYTEQDTEILLRKYFNSKVQAKILDMKMFVDNKEVNPAELIATNNHSFEGWYCQLGNNYRYIRADGSIYGAACGVATCIGNVYEAGEQQQPNVTKCTAKSCDCQVDLILNTKDVVRKN